jgi:hypothetical protein
VDKERIPDFLVVISSDSIRDTPVLNPEFIEGPWRVFTLGKEDKLIITKSDIAAGMPLRRDTVV